jgi:hypothetical protein
MNLTELIIVTIIWVMRKFIAGYPKRSVRCFGIRYRYLKLRVGVSIAVGDEGN